MSPLRVEVMRAGKWVQAFEVKPGEKGSLSDIKPGRRDVYVLYCASDNSKSIISRSVFGVDREIGPLREIRTEKLETIKELKKDESFEMTLKPEKSPAPRRIRFSHY